MMSLRKSLRRGSVWLDHSLSFRERDQMLIPPAQWAVQRDEEIELLGMPWNNARMHEVVVRLRRDGIPVEDDWLRRIGPAHFSHINFRGTMKFGVEKFAAALDPACADPGNWGGIVTSSAIAELRGYRRAVLTTVVKQPKIPT